MSDLSVLRDVQNRLQEIDIDTVKELIRPLLAGSEMQFPIIPMGTTLFRGRLISDKFKKSDAVKIVDLTYPPRQYAELGRVNRMQDSLFYCSTVQEAVYYELQGLSTGDEVILSCWRTNAPLLVSNLGYTQFVFDILGAKRTLPVWRKFDNQKQFKLSIDNVTETKATTSLSSDQNRELQEAISAAFALDVNESSRYKYKLTVALSELYMEEVYNSRVQISGILYPSMKMSANDDNVALKIEYVDKQLEFFKAKHIKILKREGMRLSISMLDFADNVSDDGALDWKGRLPKFVLKNDGTGNSITIIRFSGADVYGDYEIDAEGKAYHWTARDQQGKLLKWQ